MDRSEFLRWNTKDGDNLPDGRYSIYLKGIEDQMKDELDFLTHIIWGHDGDYNEFPDAQITDGALMISAISPFAKKVTARIEKLKDALGQLNEGENK